MARKGKTFMILAVITVAVFALVYFGITLTANLGKSTGEITAEDADKKLGKLYKEISVNQAEPVKGQIDLDPADVGEALPDIAKFPVSVENTTGSYVEIFSSTEKSGTGNDGWLNEVASAFNEANIEVDGAAVSVKIRNIASGTAADYIRSGKYIPDAYTPSNELWGEMVKAGGIRTDLVTDRLAGNVAGVVTAKKKYDELIAKYGALNVKTITDAISANELSMGYTDPFASSTGLNFLITALGTFDSSDLLGDKAVQGFEKFQANVPFTASTTLQMRDAAKSGMLDAFVLEYQTFVNAAEFKSGYVFTPFGVRHDSPLYALGELPEEKREILRKFAEFAAQDSNQQLASAKGFNGLDDYVSELAPPDGTLLTSAQKLWKEKKNGSTPLAAVFVADVSGSMAGEPLNRLKESLLKGQKNLGKDNSIGFVSYSSDVTINLPIGKYDTNQQSMFVGAVNSLQAAGGTATFDGMVVAMKMLQDELAANPGVKPVMFLLSDGETNEGHSLDDIRSLIETYKIPVYTIGYNANIKALESISGINEAASINADTDDVVYKISNLLNVQM
ncbi:MULTISPECIES: VWA domain-containing protein [unclassified Paenibacillus]|uniref:VWA domain-containing protein n=1 Tax=unclassified Paenibacillus TaxID=185978 RepID=UPI002407452E|nr:MULTISPECIES: VWA domain-containing protein [unclassified Paenibacillus]MDF9839011.1 Ca-activated chloride channel family protein [Paenibacillus sp. PastF-2]MDF9845593.1 Ca-activated chloride channel family protein [Paenibacillus sp. PastM-2]MDF9852164.1 Ca-activated chloride channel family protein [Paenibacillus sp. PastF-1]MDH6478106.1 Ca-activated chloride channel family protein [Paenibacillus sp. PastH-2]MDH6505840.1 Ca-activated chloride channel family protein [Paenibacillus sp. PastM-